MGRDELSGKAESGGFVEYGKGELPKVNAMRRDKSRPDFYGVPILTDAEVMFTTEAELGGKPASCYTCINQNSELTCNRIGPGVKVEKVKGARDSGEQIEYWPCCSGHYYCEDVAKGNRFKPDYAAVLETPDSLGLVWINAPKPGLPFGGANCGGVKGGDDCDHYITYGKAEKWDTTEAYCRVLAHDVAAGAVCTAWRDDDILWPHEALLLMRGEASFDAVMKKRFARAIVGRDQDQD